MEKDITLKEVFERLVALEAKFDLQVNRGESVTRKFWTFTIGIIGVELFNFVLNLILIYYFIHK